MSFTWIPIYSEIARKVLAFESRQEELLELLREMRSEGMKVILLNDRDAEGTRIALEEIDPFTFFASFNRTSSVSGRQAMLAKINSLLDDRVRPALAGDGGGLQVMGLDGKTLFIRYQGACGSCPSSTSGTLMAIQNLLQAEVDEELVVTMS